MSSGASSLLWIEVQVDGRSVIEDKVVLAIRLSGKV
jgi:hypothetical protein